MPKKIAEFHVNGLPPTINHMYMRGHRTVYKNEYAREWQEYTVAILKGLWHEGSSLTQALELRVTLLTKSRRKWDIDNRIKAVQDCLQQAGIIANDNQIEILHAERHQAQQDRTQIILLEVEE